MTSPEKEMYVTLCVIGWYLKDGSIQCHMAQRCHTQPGEGILLQAGQKTVHHALKGHGHRVAQFRFPSYAIRRSVGWPRLACCGSGCKCRVDKLQNRSHPPSGRFLNFSFGAARALNSKWSTYSTQISGWSLYDHWRVFTSLACRVTRNWNGVEKFLKQNVCFSVLLYVSRCTA